MCARLAEPHWHAGNYRHNVATLARSPGRVRCFVTPGTAPRQAAVLHSLRVCSNLQLTFIESVMPSNHLILLPPSPPGFSLSQHQDL